MRTPIALILALSAGAAAAQTGCAPPACLELGGFTATAQRLTLGDRPLDASVYVRSVRATVRLHNTGSEPLVLAYKGGSLRLADDIGQEYVRGAARIQGIGVAEKGRVDPQFRLAPGEARDIQLENEKSYRVKPQRQPMGAVFTVDFALVEVKLKSYDRIETVREHAVALADVQGRVPLLGGDAGGSAAGGLDKLSKALKKLGH